MRHNNLNLKFLKQNASPCRGSAGAKIVKRTTGFDSQIRTPGVELHRCIVIPLQRNSVDIKYIEVVKNLVIVESPAKAKTIEGFLGKEFTVKSSFGHIRDLSKKQLGVDIEKNFEPHYEIPADKTRIVADLKKAAKEAEVVWLASDEDREGEAISWHLAEALNLKPEKTRRIVFHEITKQAITRAIENPRSIDINLVNAQQARRVLDRLVGFEISPLLWRKVKPSLSAGRVQSVAVRLIVDKEEEIKGFRVTTWYRVTGKFFVSNDKGEGSLVAELNRRFPSAPETVVFLEKLKAAAYKVTMVEKKPARKSPAPPFTTSTLQQEAARKLGYPVARTMTLAQQLYEAGFITYMRTDSVNLSDTAIAAAKTEIIASFGHQYSQTRRFTTKTKGAQEAHEAIRPTYFDQPTAGADDGQRKLYDLIRKRTIASQMADAELEKTTINIGISTTPTEEFIARGEVVKFDGFLKVYAESTDDEITEETEGILPPVAEGEPLTAGDITATQKFSQQPARYSEASLVKKLEELGIGRPSTYAPIISTIQKREYVEKSERPGIIRNYDVITLHNGKIDQKIKNEKTGVDKGKLFPTDIGILVNQYLVSHFPEIIDYQFTATVEKEFDEIADGHIIWNNVISTFYTPFRKTVEKAMESTEKVRGERDLGLDPTSGKRVCVKLARFGPIVQLGETESESGEKPKFAGLRKGQSMETITLDDALDLLRFPRLVGHHEGEEITAAIGRFGPYLLHRKLFYSLPAAIDPLTVDEQKAIEIMLNKQEKDRLSVLKTFPDDETVIIRNGRFGPYIACGKTNVPIPKSTDPTTLTLDDCRKMAETYLATKGKTRPTRNSDPAKKTAAKKTSKKEDKAADEAPGKKPPKKAPAVKKAPAKKKAPATKKNPAPKKPKGTPKQP